MSVANPNLALLESVVAALGSLCPRFVFIGGCVTGLLITEAGAPPVRTTRDVDVIVEVVSLGEYHTVERQLEQAGLRHDRSAQRRDHRHPPGNRVYRRVRKVLTFCCLA
jgi:hypothetical protein